MVRGRNGAVSRHDPTLTRRYLPRGIPFVPHHNVRVARTHPGRREGLTPSHVQGDLIDREPRQLWHHEPQPSHLSVNQRHSGPAVIRPQTDSRSDPGPWQPMKLFLRDIRPCRLHLGINILCANLMPGQIARRRPKEHCHGNEQPVRRALGK